jgi:tripartite-type tricarboxylate transporter receptor subunit TctC
MSRVLARHLPKYIPGKPALIVKNMLGGASLIAANYVYSQAKPDGLTIGGLNRGLGTSQLMEGEGVKYDYLKYSWIGSASSEPTAFEVATRLGYKTWADLLKNKDKKLFIGCAGLGNYSRILPLLFRDDLGMNIEMVTYPETLATIVLAIERGESDGHYSTYSTYLPHIKRGLVVPLCRGRVTMGDKELEKLPLNEDLVKSKTAKGIMQIFSSVDTIARPYLAPPGTPENIMNILRDAFAQVSKDRELLAEVAKLEMEYNFIPASDAMKSAREIMTLPPEVIREFKKYDKL